MSEEGVRYSAHDGPAPVVVVPVKAVPGASRSKIVGPLGERLKVAVAAPPERGAANDELCRLIAKRLGVRGKDVRVASGLSSPMKSVEITGLSLNEVRRRLEENDAS